MIARKLFAVVFVIGLCLGLAGCGRKLGDASNVKRNLNLHKGERFSEEEIMAAMDCALESFKQFNGCTMKWITHDETRYDAETEASYMSSLLAETEVSPENVILLFSEFRTPKGAAAGGFYPDTVCSDWKWYLMRDSKDGEWRVMTWGYC